MMITDSFVTDGVVLNCKATKTGGYIVTLLTPKGKFRLYYHGENRIQTLMTTAQVVVKIVMCEDCDLPWLSSFEIKELAIAKPSQELIWFLSVLEQLCPLSMDADKEFEFAQGILEQELHGKSLKDQIGALLLTLINISGFGLNMDGCLLCGASLLMFCYDTSEMGLVCPKCYHGYEQPLHISVFDVNNSETNPQLIGLLKTHLRNIIK